jgi:hypothetical protein
VARYGPVRVEGVPTMADDLGGSGQEADRPAALERRRWSRAWMATVVAGAVLAWVAFSARPPAQASSAGASSIFVEHALCDGHEGELRLPPGHPPIHGSLRLPPGHPPIDLGPESPSIDRLPPGHPPIDRGVGEAARFPPGYLIEI